jgi:hypothetical protein
MKDRMGLRGEGLKKTFATVCFTQTLGTHLSICSWDGKIIAYNYQKKTTKILDRVSKAAVLSFLVQR